MATRVRKAKSALSKKPEWNLRLYTVDNSPKSEIALRNLKTLCEEHLPGRYEIEVVDLRENPRLAVGDQVLAIPTVVRRLPAPMRKIIGTLSDRERVLIGLDLRPHAKTSLTSGKH